MKNSKIYFLRTSEDYDDILFFPDYKTMQDFLTEAVFDGDNINNYKIYSAEPDSYKNPKVRTTIEVPV